MSNKAYRKEDLHRNDLGDVSFPRLDGVPSANSSNSSFEEFYPTNSENGHLNVANTSINNFSKLSKNEAPNHPPSSFRRTGSSSLVTPVNPKHYNSNRSYKPLPESEPLPPPPVEPTPNKKLHFASLFCVMTLGFFANVEYGVIMPSIWEYIESLGGNKMQMGAAIGVCSAAQLVMLPIFGWWSDRRTMKEAYLASILVGILGNAMYASAQFFGSPWLIIGGRLFIGVYSGVISVSNSFIGCVTTPNTRTRFMAHMNGVNALGLVSGPAFNLFLAKLDIKLLPHLTIDALTAPAWFVGGLLCVSLLCFFVLFREPASPSGDEESATKGEEEDTKKGEPNTQKPAKENLSFSHAFHFMMISFSKPWGVCFMITFVQNFDFSVLETVVTIFTTSQYGFTTFENSLMYSAISMECIGVIILTAIASKYFSDRVIIIVGELFMGSAVILFLFEFDLHSPFYVFVIIVTILIIGLPSQNTAVMACFSKLIDYEYPKAKQGLYSGVLMIFGSLARILGPLWGGFATDLDPKHATKILASLLVGLSVIDFIVTLLAFNKLRVLQRPATQQTEKTPLLNKPSQESLNASMG